MTMFNYITETTMRILVLVFTLLLGACSGTAVRPWERGDLARNDMAWDPDPLQTALRDHINTAKEGASGGVTTGGGGCGCY